MLEYPKAGYHRVSAVFLSQERADDCDSREFASYGLGSESLSARRLKLAIQLADRAGHFDSSLAASKSSFR